MVGGDTGRAVLCAIGIRWATTRRRVSSDSGILYGIIAMRHLLAFAYDTPVFCSFGISLLD